MMCFETVTFCILILKFRLKYKTFKCGASTTPYRAWASGGKRHSFKYGV